MPIANVTLNNTFDEWRTTTNQLISFVNDVDGGNLTKFYSNSAVLTVTENIGRGTKNYITLNVSSNVLDTSTLNVATANAVNIVFASLANTEARIILVSNDANGINAVANAGIIQANTARVHANAAFATANAGLDQANTARIHANTAHVSSNAALEQANTARTHANAAHSTANAGLASANAGLLQANTARIHANAAFNQANTARDIANTANTLSVANTLPNGTTFIRSTRNVLNFIPTGTVVSLIQDDSAGNRINVSFEVIGISSAGQTANLAFAHANAAHNSANAGLTQANTARIHANNAYDQANLAYEFAATVSGNNANVVVANKAAYDQSNIIFNLANAAFVTANIAFANANTVMISAQAAFRVANSGFIHANAIGAIANAAFATANVAFANANTVMISAQAAFTVANSGFLHANAAFASANAGLAAGLAQANTARVHANVAFDQANTARSHANAAFLAANNAITDFSPAFVQANTARVHANTAHITANAAFDQANTARSHANAAFLAANNAITDFSPAFVQANTARVHANAAFTTANAALPNTSGASFAGNMQIPSGNLTIGDGTTQGLRLSVTGYVATSNVFPQIKASGGSQFIQLNANTSVGAWSDLMGDRDASIIFSRGTSDDSANLVIGPWTDSSFGYKQDGAGRHGFNTINPRHVLDANGSANISGSLTVNGMNVVPTITAAFAKANTIGTLGTQSSSSVSISGGSITGITDLALADGGTNASLTAAAGAVAYSTASAIALTAVGNSGEVLVSKGTGAPAWAALIPAGTAMIFAQTAAPTGWTKSTTHNDKALRVVSGSASSGGTVAFTTAFASKSVSGTLSSTTATGSISSTTATGTVGATTLTESQIPSHRHLTVSTTQTGYGTLDGSSYVLDAYSYGSNMNYDLLGTNSDATVGLTSATGGGGSHTHSFTGTSHTHTFTGTGHTHTFTGTAIDLAVQYVDVIIATKDAY